MPVRGRESLGRVVVVLCTVTILDASCATTRALPNHPGPGAGDTIREPRADDPVEIKLRLGRFASADGVVSFVLDRTGDPAKLRLDYSSEVIELDARPGVYGRTELTRRDSGQLVLFIFHDRGMRFFHPELPEGVAVSRERLATSAPASPASSARKPQPPEVKLRLGHYTSSDGTIGFVLDRTGEPPKLRYDHTEAVIDLAPRLGAEGKTELRRDDGSLALCLHRDGHLEAYHRLLGGGVEVRRDADADPLP